MPAHCYKYNVLVLLVRVNYYVRWHSLTLLHICQHSVKHCEDRHPVGHCVGRYYVWTLHSTVFGWRSLPFQWPALLLFATTYLSRQNGHANFPLDLPLPGLIPISNWITRFKLGLSLLRVYLHCVCVCVSVRVGANIQARHCLCGVAFRCPLWTTMKWRCTVLAAIIDLWG